MKFVFVAFFLLVSLAYCSNESQVAGSSAKTLDENEAKIYANFAKMINCAEKPVSKTCPQCLSTKENFRLFFYYQTTRMRKYRYKFMIHYNDRYQKIAISFSGPSAKLYPKYISYVYSWGFSWVSTYKVQIESEYKIAYYTYLRRALIRKIKKILSSGRMHYQVVFTGHSVGGSLATLAAYDLTYSNIVNKTNNHPKVFSFAGLRIGDQKFVSLVNQLIPVVRINRQDDYIVRIPTCNYSLVQKAWVCVSQLSLNQVIVDPYSTMFKYVQNYRYSYYYSVPALRSVLNHAMLNSTIKRRVIRKNYRSYSAKLPHYKLMRRFHKGLRKTRSTHRQFKLPALSGLLTKIRHRIRHLTNEKSNTSWIQRVKNLKSNLIKESDPIRNYKKALEKRQIKRVASHSKMFRKKPSTPMLGFGKLFKAKEKKIMKKNTMLNHSKLFSKQPPKPVLKHSKLFSRKPAQREFNKKPSKPMLSHGKLFSSKSPQPSLGFGKLFKQPQPKKQKKKNPSLGHGKLFSKKPNHPVVGFGKLFSKKPVPAIGHSKLFRSQPKQTIPESESKVQIERQLFKYKRIFKGNDKASKKILQPLFDSNKIPKKPSADLKAPKSRNPSIPISPKPAGVKPIKKKQPKPELPITSTNISSLGNLPKLQITPKAIINYYKQNLYYSQPLGSLFYYKPTFSSYAFCGVFTSGYVPFCESTIKLPPVFSVESHYVYYGLRFDTCDNN